MLETLSEQYAVVALVSGRLALDLQSTVGARGVVCVGLYGAERVAGGNLVQSPEAERWRREASQLADDARVLTDKEGLDGVLVEYKDLAVSVHFRNAKDERAGDVIREWAAGAASQRGFESAVGRKVVEMRPAGVSKASGLQRIIEEHGLRSLVSAGDDYQDVDAMRRARQILGDRALTVGVASAEEPDGLRETADLMLDSPAGVLDLLRRFLIASAPVK